MIFILIVHGVSSKSNMKLLMQNLKLDEVKKFNNQLSKLETELYNLIDTSKYDLSSDWPTGSYFQLYTLMFHAFK